MTVAEIDLEPRPQHYVFAHYILRQEAFKLTDQLIHALRYQDHDYIRRRWFVAMTQCRMTGMQFDTKWNPVAEIQIHSAQQDYITCYVISMPEAKHLTEAFFVAVVEAPGDVVRYYTLEKGSHDDGSPRTALCEWTADGRHLNFGDGPPATIDAFTESIFRHVNAELPKRSQHYYGR